MRVKAELILFRAKNRSTKPYRLVYGATVDMPGKDLPEALKNIEITQGVDRRVVLSITYAHRSKQVRHNTKAALEALNEETHILDIRIGDLLLVCTVDREPTVTLSKDEKTIMLSAPFEVDISETKGKEFIYNGR